MSSRAREKRKRKGVGVEGERYYGLRFCSARDTCIFSSFPFSLHLPPLTEIFEEWRIIDTTLLQGDDLAKFISHKQESNRRCATVGTFPVLWVFIYLLV